MNTDLPSTSAELQAAPKPSIREVGAVAEVSTPEVVTVAEAAAIARTNRKVISAMCVSGELPALDVGVGKHRIWRIRRDAILDVISRGNGASS